MQYIQRKWRGIRKRLENRWKEVKKDACSWSKSQNAGEIVYLVVDLARSAATSSKCCCIFRSPALASLALNASRML